MKYVFEIEENEYWWGGATPLGDKMPFSVETEIKIDLAGMDARNQSMPLLLLNKGRYIWSDEPICFEFKDGKIYVEGSAEVRIYKVGDNLRDAYLTAMKRHFPFDGAPLQEKFFSTAQYNTWMKVTYNPTQEAVLKYAHDVVYNGFEPGILIIDEGWHGRYGTWEFDRIKFPDPKAMVDELHSLGFTVMLWVCPFVTADGEKYVKSLRFGAEFEDKKISTDLFLRLEDGDVALVNWWNGTSAILDFTCNSDVEYMKTQLDKLINDFGIDGFKFDGGQCYHYSNLMCVNGKLSPNLRSFEKNIAWNEFGRQYKYHEYKDTCKGGGKCTIQRLLDRTHSWDNEGINTIIPYSLFQGLIGYPFICPDMIGGGEWSIFINGVEIEEELFVRMCQVSVFFPMMQFSMPPWEYLSKENLAICLDMAKIHKKFSSQIIEEVNKSRFSGEPIVRHLAYEFPDENFEKITDCFMFSDKILVAPVLKKGEVTRTVRLPSGWL